jgi:hypothetical protein
MFEYRGCVDLAVSRFDLSTWLAMLNRFYTVISCENIMHQTGISNVTPTELVNTLRRIASNLIEIRLALRAEEDSAAASVFEFRLREPYASDSIEAGSHIAYLVRRFRCQRDCISSY